MNERQPLATRCHPVGWNEFESSLFNLVTKIGDRKASEHLFSVRCRITDAMLKAYDDAVAAEAE